MAARFLLQLEDAARHAIALMATGATNVDPASAALAQAAGVAPQTVVVSDGFLLRVAGDAFVQLGPWWVFRLFDTALPAALHDVRADTLRALLAAGVSPSWREIDRVLAQWEDHAAWLFVQADERRVAVYRDPIGLCPVSIYAGADGWQITNTGEALRPVLHQDAALRDDAVTDIVTLGFVQRAETTIYQALFRVPPGHRWTLDGGEALRHIASPSGSPRYQPWWRWTPPPLVAPTPSDAIVQYRTLLQEVCTTYVDERPIVMELSGGMDSSSVLAALASRDDHAQRIETLTYCPPSGPDEEHRLAALTSARWGLRHHQAPQPMTRAAVALDPRVDALAELLASVAEVLPGARTVFSGQGGDLLFQLTQHDMDRQARDLSSVALLRYAAYQRSAQLGLPPLFLRQRLSLGAPSRDYRDRSFGWLQPRLRDHARAMSLQLHQDASHSDGRTAMILHPKWSDLFEMYDAGWTRLPLAYRFPLFDLRVIRFVAALPAVPFLLRKHVARAAFADLLPLAVLQRPKTLLDVERDALLTPAAIRSALAHTDIERWFDPDVLRRTAEHPASVPKWMHLAMAGSTSFVRWRQRFLAVAP